MEVDSRPSKKSKLDAEAIGKLTAENTTLRAKHDLKVAELNQRVSALTANVNGMEANLNRISGERDRAVTELAKFMATSSLQLKLAEAQVGVLPPLSCVPPLRLHLRLRGGANHEDTCCPLCFEPGHGRHTWLEERDGAIIAHADLCADCLYEPAAPIVITSRSWARASLVRRILRVLRQLSHEDKSRRSRYSYLRPVLTSPYLKPS
jgi:uncharacterized small protein (DUF1192 family)